MLNLIFAYQSIRDMTFRIIADMYFCFVSCVVCLPRQPSRPESAGSRNKLQGKKNPVMRKQQTAKVRLREKS